MSSQLVWYTSVVRLASQAPDATLSVDPTHRWPGRIKPGRVTDAIASTMDIFPTMLALAGVKLPPRIIDGMDLSSVLFEDNGVLYCFIPWHAYTAVNNSQTCYKHCLSRGLL